jgi:hypothetical protein
LPSSGRGSARTRPGSGANRSGPPPELPAILNEPHDEWEILYRQRLQVERDLLAGQAPGSVLPSDAQRRKASWRGERRRAEGPLGDRVEGLIAAAGFVLIALDVVTTLIDRRRDA